jgi:hypothetical protein
MMFFREFAQATKIIESNGSFLEERTQNLKSNFQPPLNVPSALSSEITCSEKA